MMHFLLLFLLTFSHSAFADDALDNSLKLFKIQEIKRLAFGSCNNQNAPQPLWDDLLERKPDLFVFGGDSIYPDWAQEPVEVAYAKQNQVPGFIQFKKQTPIIGVWDDHDYGYDNADGNYKGKVQSQKAFLNFIMEPLWSMRWIQEGVYKSYTFGPQERKIKIILLDNRYFEALDPEAPLLGKKQWVWLENELAKSDASVNFIVTGLSVLSPHLPVSDSWVDFEPELTRMLDLVKKTQAKGVVFLTGDKHFGTIFKNHNQLEFLSSGMTHVVRRAAWTYLKNHYTNTYFGLNYGEINISWTPDNEPILNLNIRTQYKTNARSVTVQLKNNEWKASKGLINLEIQRDPN